MAVRDSGRQFEPGSDQLTPQARAYFNNLTLFDVQLALPGVFADNVYAHAVNGSTWTLPIEVFMYVLLALGSVLFLGRWRMVMITVIAMIEDPEAIDDIDAILAVNGLDGVFVGRGDLAVALQDREPDTPQVRAATDRVIKATRQIGKPVCLLASGPAEAREFVACGVTAFVISSDQGFMRSAAASALKDYKSAASISQ